MSEAFDTGDVLAWTGGDRLQGTDARFEGVSIDTRTIAPGDLFIAIAGPNFDAHDFLPRAAEAGAAGFVVAAGNGFDGAALGDRPVVAVPDTRIALGAIARGHRNRFTGPVVAITGSNGKTTTKEICAALFSVEGPCLKTEGNLNNDFGLPLTLLRRRPEDRAAIVELGMNHRGEIAYLVDIARPNFGLITNIGTAHIEHLGSREEIAREKGDLFAGLDSQGVALVNIDDERVAQQAERAAGRRITYGLSEGAQVRATKIDFVDGERFQFVLETPDGEVGVQLRGLGETTVINAVAACAAAFAAGIPIETIRLGLDAYEPIAGRMSQKQLASGVTVVDDTYNANPQSMRAALESLARLKGAGRAFAVLGDMGELGDTRDEAHRLAGQWAAELGIDFVLAIGDQAELVASSARKAGLDASHVRVCDDHDDASAQIQDRLQPGDWVLVKGSRAMRMERVVYALTGEEGL